MQRDTGELSEAERPMPADGRVLRAHLLQRPRHVGCEDHVHDVLARRARRRRDRVDERDGALERDIDALREQPRLLPEFPLQRVQEALPRVDAAAGQEPDLLAALFVPAEEDPSSPPEDGGHPHARRV
jgi:hypothetical protein